MTVLVGTSGFSYEDWRGHFYPAELKKTEFLTYYSQHFAACEINYTYYAMPAARTMQALVDKSAGRVTFAIKAHQSMTHAGTADHAAVSGFDRALEPLRQAGVLGPLLLQFPWGFKPGPAARERVQRLAEQLAGNELVVELRNAEWINAATLDWLRSLGLGYCCVDEPRLRGLVPALAAATSNVGYVRFHGRNAAKWYNHERPEERYDYLYTEGQLMEWAPRIKELERRTDRTFVFTNNHFQSKAVLSARMLIDLLNRA